MLEIKLRIGRKIIYFKKEATQWLGVWLDSQLKFAFHINKKMKKAKVAEAQIKKLSKTYRFCLRLIQKIQVITI